MPYLAGVGLSWGLGSNRDDHGPAAFGLLCRHVHGLVHACAHGAG